MNSDLENTLDSKFNWTVEKRPSIYEKVNCDEYCDIEHLNGFLNTEMGITEYVTSKQKYVGYKGEQNQVAHYYATHKNKSNSFKTFHDLPNHGWGRTKARNNNSLNIFHRTTRHTVCEEYYVDIDLKNAHPSFLYSFAKHHNLPCTILKEYCDDTKRFRNDLMSVHYKTDVDKIADLKKKNKLKEAEVLYNKIKDSVKKLPISLINAGSYKGWKKEQELDTKQSLEKILKLEIELKLIGDEIYKHNPQIVKDIKNHEPDYFNDYSKSEKRTTIALWCQTIERYLIEDTIAYISEKYKIPIGKIVPCQDGFMIKKKKYKKKILQDINQFINDSYPYNVVYEIKAFDEGIEIPKHETLQYDITDLIRHHDETKFLEYEPEEYINLGKSKHIEVYDDDYDDAHTIIIQGGTGTGKSKCVTDQTARYLKSNSHIRVLCVSNMIAVLNEIKKKFEDNHNIHLMNYEYHDGTDLIENNSYICTNSLYKLEGMDFTDTIVYIDEPTSTFMSMPNNDTYQYKKTVLNVLNSMFRNCHKLIITDAHMTNTIGDIIKKRKTPPEKLYYYINTYKKFKDSKAYHVEDENKFLETMIKRLEDDEPFVACFNQANNAQSILEQCKAHATKEQIERFVLVTKNTKININDVECEDKFIFYSPKIVCGTSIELNNPTDTFIHISATRTINPVSMYQQATRNRNMKNLYFYVEKQKPEKMKPKHASYKACVKHYQNCMKACKDLYENALVVNEDELNIVDNSFYFKLFTHVTYTISVLFSDIYHYFTKELINAGFTVEKMGYEVNNFTDEIKEQLKEHNTKIKTEDLKFVETNIDNDMFEEDDNVYSKRASMLNIETKEEFRKFTPVLENDYKFNQYLKFEKLCATEEEINTRLNNKLQTGEVLDLVKSDYNKILVVRQFEKHYNIKPMDLKQLYDTELNTENNSFILTQVSKRFRLKATEPKLLYISMLKQINKDVIQNSKECQITIEDGVRTYKYNYEIDNLKYYLELMILRYKTRNNHISENPIICSLFEQCDMKIPSLVKPLIIKQVNHKIKKTTEIKPCKLKDHVYTDTNMVSGNAYKCSICGQKRIIYNVSKVKTSYWVN